MICNRYQFAILLWLITYATVSFSMDYHDKIRISADATEFDYKHGIDTYRGNVIVDQGESHLTADCVVTKKNSQHKLEQITAYGNHTLAHYWAVLKKGENVFHAQANIIKFYPTKTIVVLEKNAVVTQGNNSFHGDLIVYNIKDQTISTPATNKGRNIVVIDPKQMS